jgi:acetoin utilization protein AcuB
MRIRDIMTTDVETIRPEASADLAWQRMQRSAIHHLVVVDRGETVGVLSDRDLGGARGASLRRERTVADLMSAQVVAAEPDTTLRRAANIMRGRSLGCLPVLDEGKLRGIVTVSDLLEQVGKERRQPRWTLSQRGPRGTRPARRSP